MSETQLHPGLLEVSRRLCNLLLSKRLTETEALHMSSGIKGLSDVWLVFWDDLNALASQDLPETDCRPAGTEVFTFLSDRSMPRNFNLALGYLHRLWEYAERLEAKYRLCEGAA
ncbi:hypothetical protein [Yoonia vestfoldensis]|uniref:Uncharacterized protein n=1 Tax=Yoonia vestfoldensis TaxID=245188 RepID=A0A1Y0EBJ4_9RHOB|nr:hypothetical protein [Yoonia vestfoldensis]ARU00868.1 hypothetical protein LOKVESSMR4R_01552 [Yoonia vestfoldensis]